MSHLGALDYVIFAGAFVISATIGVTHCVLRQREEDANGFHLNSRSSNPWAVGVSLATTYVSGVFIVGIPADVYAHGPMVIWYVVSILIAIAGAAHVFLPVFYNLNRVSCFEYIQQRFGRETKMVASTIYVFQTLLLLGFVLYAPSMVCQSMTGLSLYAIMAVGIIVCTFYTTLGGMRTVIWADNFQFALVIAGIIAVLVMGIQQVGSIGNVWRLANEGGRLAFTDFSPDPTARHTVWTMSIGDMLTRLYLYDITQAAVQRSCSLPTLRSAKIALWIAYPILFVVIIILILMGLVIFAYYRECDPVASGQVRKPDHVVPLFVIAVFGKTPGLKGLYLACLFSGCLSTISSALSALSAVTMEDFVKPLVKKRMLLKREMLFIRLSVVAYGALNLGTGVIISALPGMVHQMLISVLSITSGPLLGLFISGIIFPWTNKKGAIAGVAASILLTSWIVFGRMFVLPKGHVSTMPVSTIGCYQNDTVTLPMSIFFNATYPTLSINYSNVTSPSDLGAHGRIQQLYKMSYLWYCGLGMILCVAISLGVSVLTGRNRAKDVDCKLMSPLFYTLTPCLPMRYRRFLLFGVVYKDKCQKVQNLPQSKTNDIEETEGMIEARV